MGRCPSSLAPLAFPPRKQGGKHTCARTSGRQDCAGLNILGRDLWVSYLAAISSISTLAPSGRAATSTVDLAGFDSPTAAP